MGSSVLDPFSAEPESEELEVGGLSPKEGGDSSELFDDVCEGFVFFFNLSQ